MTTVSRFGIGFAVSLLAVTASAAQGPAAGPYVGEVRAIALAKGNQDVVMQLHHDGWLEANGQILAAGQYPALYRQIGRTWTAAGVPENRFAIPRLRDTTQLVSSPDPHGVLGGEAPTPTSGRSRRPVPSNPLSYWIFVGQDVARDRQ